MTYPRHWLMQFGGPSFGGTEQWSCNLRFHAEFPLPLEPNNQQVAEDLLAYMAERFSQSATNSAQPGFGITASSSLEYVKFNEIGPDGKYQDQSESHTAFTTPVPGYSGATAPTYPPQVAACVSWRTDVQRGPASKGRIYLPSPEIPIVAATGTATGTMPANIAAAWADHLEQFQNIVSIGIAGNTFYPAVVSQVGDGHASTIRKVLVGNVLDTQRRRRNELTEVYQDASVNY